MSQTAVKLPPIPILMGPTASGKTAVSIQLARALGAEIINADSMQIYADLRTITARPDPEEEAQARHHLFGVLDAGDVCSAQRWVAMAEQALADIEARGRRALIVGGTGFYIRAMTEGLDEIPEISPAVRKQVRSLQGKEAYDLLVARDPNMAARLAPRDGQRVRRALEVIEQTGRSLADFQSGHAVGLDRDFRLFKLLPERQALYRRCDLRLARMWPEAINEVEAYLARHPQPDWPLTKAIGVPQIADYLAGRLTCDQALQAAQQKTRNYAKRQLTWLRNQHPEASNITFSYKLEQQMERAVEFMMANLTD